MWPRRSWQRSYEYLKKRMVRLSASPHAIALGFAVGAFASCTPFVGFHFVIAACLAFVLGGSLISSAIGTAVGNPITFPFIWATTFKIGDFFLPDAKVRFPGTEMSADFFDQSVESILPVLGRMLVGSIPIGLVVAIVCYFSVRSLTRAYQKARRRRLQDGGPLRLGARASARMQDPA